MKSLNILVRINFGLINKTGINSILMISAHETALGFIHVEESLVHGTPDRITPFTAGGLLPEADCYDCAVLALATQHFHLPEEALNAAIAETIHGPAEMLAAMLAGLSKASRAMH